MKVIPEHILKLMSPEDRRAIGQKTWSECLANCGYQYEKQLQKEVLGRLESKGVVVFYQRMDKKTRGRKGQPDHIFAVNGEAIAWEYKSPSGKCSIDQERVSDAMQQPPNYWRVKVIRSLPEALHEMYELGL